MEREKKEKKNKKRKNREKRKKKRKEYYKHFVPFNKRSSFMKYCSKTTTILLAELLMQPKSTKVVRSLNIILKE